VRERRGEQHQTERRQTDAGPLAGADVEPEEPLSEHREEDEPTRDHSLDERQRRHGQRGDVEGPGQQRHEHAEREPLGAEQPDRARQWVLERHVWRGVRAAVLEQEARVGRERAQQRKKNSNLDRQGWR
jgi:hypothetical protein